MTTNDPIAAALKANAEHAAKEAERADALQREVNALREGTLPEKWREQEYAKLVAAAEVRAQELNAEIIKEAADALDKRDYWRSLAKATEHRRRFTARKAATLRENIAHLNEAAQRKQRFINRLRREKEELEGYRGGFFAIAFMNGVLLAIVIMQAYQGAN